MFAKFKELKTKEEQATSEELQEHANKVMNTLDEGIRGLDDLDTFFEFIHQVGASHRRIPGFKQEYFWVIALQTHAQTPPSEWGDKSGVKAFRQHTTKKHPPPHQKGLLCEGDSFLLEFVGSIAN